jgi:hypothetical protein
MVSTAGSSSASRECRASSAGTAPREPSAELAAVERWLVYRLCLPLLSPADRRLSRVMMAPDVPRRGLGLAGGHDGLLMPSANSAAAADAVGVSRLMTSRTSLPWPPSS